MEIDSSSQPTSAPVPCPPLNGLHRPILGESDGSRLREMLEGVDTSLKRSLPLDFMSSNPETFLEAPVALKRPRMDEGELLAAADRNVTTITELMTLNRCIETSGALHHDGTSSTQRQRDERVNHCNDLNSAPIFRSVLFEETSTKFQHFSDSTAISSSHAVPPPDTNLKHDELSKSLTPDHCPGEVTHDQCSAPVNPSPVVISCSDPFHDLTGDVSLQVCTSLDENPPTHPDAEDAEEKEEEEEEQPKTEELTRERRQSARMAAVKLSKKEMQAVRKKMREEEKEEKRRKREEQQEKKRLKALEIAERKRLREEQKIKKAAEMEEKKRKRAIEMEERRKKKEAEEELKKRRKEELQERLRQREEERRQQQEAKARRDEENKKQKAPVKKRRKPNELVADEVEEGEDGWKKNAGLTMEDREKIPLGPMSGVERVFSWLFGKHSDTADLPPYLHMNEELNRILPQLQVATVTESHDAQKE